MQGCLVLVSGGESDISLGFRTIAVLRLQTGRQRCLIDVADGSQVIVGYPLPQLQLLGRDNRF